MEQELAIIVDGSYFLHRAWNIVPIFAHNYSVCKNPTNAVHGFLRAFTSLINRFPSKFVAVVFDSPEPTFRHDLDPNYKADRPKPPEELTNQLEFLKRLIPALGYTLAIHPGIEGDDIIGTLAKEFENLGHKVLIATGDKDISQLVTDNVIIEKNQTTPLMYPKDVCEKFGVTPEQIPDYLALIGDRVDGIKGIPGFGGKTSIKWLEKYGSIDGILNAFENNELDSKELIMIKDHVDRLEHNLKMTTIQTNEDIGFEEHAFVVMPRNNSELKNIAKQLNMGYWMDQY